MFSSRSDTPIKPPAVTPQAAQRDLKLLRRSSRLFIDIPVEIICKGPQNSVRTEETKTMTVSAHGCGLSLKTGVLPGEKIVLIHKMSREEIICRVIMCKQGKAGIWETGIEFQSPSPNFWHITFPPDDWDPSFREQVAAGQVKK